MNKMNKKELLESNNDAKTKISIKKLEDGVPGWLNS